MGNLITTIDKLDGERVLGRNNKSTCVKDHNFRAKQAT